MVVLQYNSFLTQRVLIQENIKNQSTNYNEFMDIFFLRSQRTLRLLEILIEIDIILAAGTEPISVI